MKNVERKTFFFFAFLSIFTTFAAEIRIYIKKYD